MGKPDFSESCFVCGMHVPGPGAYHPHAACLMFQSCRNGNTVDANLHAVLQFAIEHPEAALAAIEGRPAIQEMNR